MCSVGFTPTVVLFSLALNNINPWTTARVRGLFKKLFPTRVAFVRPSLTKTKSECAVRKVFSPSVFDFERLPLVPPAAFF